MKKNFGDGVDTIVLIGCGILKNEIKFLINKNKWPIKSFFLNSSLHVDFDKLSKSLNKMLDNFKDNQKIVFYGCCHPSMDEFMINSNSLRTNGQNCIEILLGKELFTNELENGAFFLLDDWAKNFDKVTIPVFGNEPKYISHLFKNEHKYLLAINTPCSVDFSKDTESVSHKTGLPIKWLNVNLDKLEDNLAQILTQFGIE